MIDEKYTIKVTFENGSTNELNNTTKPEGTIKFEGIWKWEIKEKTIIINMSKVIWVEVIKQ